MDLYNAYTAGKIDLSPFGIHRGETRSDYFCTPRGARVIGWTGVDGIHYCRIPALGDTVFAVDPMGEPGRHAYPVAGDFGELLSLLIACGHEAVLAQAHAWSPAQYDRFRKENPMTETAIAAAEALARQWQITPAADPYTRLHTLAADFDYAAIPWRRDYYEWVPKEEPPAPPRPWAVYFAGEGGRERPGVEIPYRARFTWAGASWCVPAAYACAKGLVLDLFARLDADRVAEYFAWYDFAEAHPEEVTADQRQQKQAECPFTFDFRADITVNGRTLKEKQGRGGVWIPQRDGYTDETLEEILAHYGLDPAFPWLYRRISFPWATAGKPKIKTAVLHLTEHPAPLPGPRFTVAAPGEVIPFTHPITGASHTLTVTGYTREEMQPNPGMSAYDFPTHFIRMTYTLTPDLPGRVFLLQDAHPGDPPRKRPDAQEQVSARKKEYDFVSVAAVSVIGGADGPVAVIAGVPDAPEGRTALSSLTFTPAASVEWRMRFCEKRTADTDVPLTADI